MSLDAIKKQAITIIKEIEDLKRFEGEKTYTFIRKYYSTYSKFSTWKILLDKSKSRLCTRDASGFKHMDASEFDQTVNAPVGTRDLLLAKSKKDREVAQTILTQLAEEKYG